MAVRVPLKRFPLSVLCGCVRNSNPATAIITETTALQNKTAGAQTHAGRQLKTMAQRYPNGKDKRDQKQLLVHRLFEVGRAGSWPRETESTCEQVISYVLKNT